MTIASVDRHARGPRRRLLAATRSLAKAIGTLSVVGISLPTFWIGLMLITVLSIRFGCLPTGGRGPTASILGIESSLFTRDGLAPHRAARAQPVASSRWR